jgi:hypothetical protein
MKDPTITIFQIRCNTLLFFKQGYGIAEKSPGDGFARHCSRCNVDISGTQCLLYRPGPSLLFCPMCSASVDRTNEDVLCITDQSWAVLQLVAKTLVYVGLWLEKSEENKKLCPSHMVTIK